MYNIPTKPNRLNEHSAANIADFNNYAKRTYLVKNLVKIYPTFIKLYEYHTPKSIKVDGFDTSKTYRSIGLEQTALQKEQNVINSLRRTKTTLKDMVLSNDFKYFITFTFSCRNCPDNCKNYITPKNGTIPKCSCNPETCQRNNPARQKKRMAKWLRNYQDRNGKIGYIIVPEYHKDKRALHFHALFTHVQTPLTYSGHKINGRKSYKFPAYTLGFSSVVKIDNSPKVASYVSKYITKDMPTDEQKSRYWCSQNLKRPRKLHNIDVQSCPQIRDYLVLTYESQGLSILECSYTLPLQLNEGKNPWLKQHQTILVRQMTQMLLKVNVRLSPPYCKQERLNLAINTKL